MEAGLTSLGQLRPDAGQSLGTAPNTITSNNTTTGNRYKPQPPTLSRGAKPPDMAHKAISGGLLLRGAGWRAIWKAFAGADDRQPQPKRHVRQGVATAGKNKKVERGGSVPAPPSLDRTSPASVVDSRVIKPNQGPSPIRSGVRSTKHHYTHPPP